MEMSSLGCGVSFDGFAVRGGPICVLRAVAQEELYVHRRMEPCALRHVRRNATSKAPFLIERRREQAKWKRLATRMHTLLSDVSTSWSTGILAVHFITRWFS